jgi:hypothetical protein
MSGPFVERATLIINSVNGTVKCEVEFERQVTVLCG